jgi:3-phenylpropionate/trans-cinnamate dioxygenase ferredoxin subunit
VNLRLCALDDLALNSSNRYGVEGHRLAVIRFEGDEVYIIGDECSHADYSLAEGELDTDDKTLECWKRGSTFNLETGEPECLPATKAVPTYETSVLDGEIIVVLP